jgi:hypothetical protein
VTNIMFAEYSVTFWQYFAPKKTTVHRNTSRP